MFNKYILFEYNGITYFWHPSSSTSALTCWTDDKKILSSAHICENTSYHCRTKLMLKKFCYTWSIANFWEIYEYITELYSSNVKDYFKFYMSNTKNSLKFYVIIDKNKSNLTGSYSVFLKTNETDIMCKSESVHELYNEELLYELPISKWNPTYLSNGTFTICFKFHIFQNLLNSSIYHTYSGEFFFDMNENFISNEKYDSFITFVINKKCLYANKNLLCSHSKVFEAMFHCDLKESADDKIEITDTSYDIFKELLFFLHNDYLSKKINTDAEALCELFFAAEKYDIKSLKSICEHYLIINTTIKNVIEHFKIAHLNCGNSLEKYAIEFMKLHFEDIEDTSEFKILVQKYPKLLVQIKNVETLEISNGSH